MKEITNEIETSGLRKFVADNFQGAVRDFLSKSNDPQREYYEGSDFWELDRYERYYNGLQHDDKKYNWDGTMVAMDAEHRTMNNASGIAGQATGRKLQWYLRRPYIREQLCPVIVDRFSDLLFSKRNRPCFGEYEENYTKFFNKLTQKTKFWSKLLWARDQAGAMGTVVVGIIVRNGLPQIQVLNAKYCHPLFEDNDPDTGKLAALEVMFKYDCEIEYYDQRTRQTTKKKVTKLYRRIITSEYDICGTAILDDQKPVWVISSAYEHKLGFVPFEWIQNDGNCADTYGYADLDQELDNLDCLDAIMSQAFRGTLYNSDPTLVLGLMGKDAPNSIETGSGVALVLDPTMKEDAKLLEMNGTGPKTGLDIEERIRKTILRDVRCVLPEELVNANTASEIQARIQAMIDRVDRLRENWETHVLNLMEMMIKVLNMTNENGVTTASSVPWLRGVEIPTAEVMFELQWPALSEIDEHKIQAKVSAYVSAIVGGIMSRETAVKLISSDLGYSYPEEELERIVKEREDEFLNMAKTARNSMISKNSSPEKKVSESPVGMNNDAD